MYKIRHDTSGARLTFIKALSGKLKVRDELDYHAGGESISEKATRLFLVSGPKLQPVDQVAAGDLFAATGLSAAETGQGLGAAHQTGWTGLLANLVMRRHRKDIPVFLSHEDESNRS